jgi:hypothetical protein
MARRLHSLHRKIKCRWNCFQRRPGKISIAYELTSPGGCKTSQAI